MKSMLGPPGLPSATTGLPPVGVPPMLIGGPPSSAVVPTAGITSSTSSRDGEGSSGREKNPRSREDRNWKYLEKIPIDESQFPPGIKAAAIIIGARGCNHARMQDEGGCCVQLRGQGISSPGTPGSDEPMHLWVKYDQPSQLQRVKEVLYEIIRNCDRGDGRGSLGLPVLPPQATAAAAVATAAGVSNRTLGGPLLNMGTVNGLTKPIECSSSGIAAPGSSPPGGGIGPNRYISDHHLPQTAVVAGAAAIGGGGCPPAARAAGPNNGGGNNGNRVLMGGGMPPSAAAGQGVASSPPFTPEVPPGSIPAGCLPPKPLRPPNSPLECFYTLHYIAHMYPSSLRVSNLQVAYEQFFGHKLDSRLSQLGGTLLASLKLIPLVIRLENEDAITRDAIIRPVLPSNITWTEYNHHMHQSEAAAKAAGGPPPAHTTVQQMPSPSSSTSPAAAGFPPMQHPHPPGGAGNAPFLRSEMGPPASPYPRIAQQQPQQQQPPPVMGYTGTPTPKLTMMPPPPEPHHGGGGGGGATVPQPGAGGGGGACPAASACSPQETLRRIFDVGGGGGGPLGSPHDSSVTPAGLIIQVIHWHLSSAAVNAAPREALQSAQNLKAFMIAQPGVPIVNAMKFFTQGFGIDVNCRELGFDRPETLLSLGSPNYLIVYKVSEPNILTQYHLQEPSFFVKLGRLCCQPNLSFSPIDEKWRLWNNLASPITEKAAGRERGGGEREGGAPPAGGGGTPNNENTGPPLPSNYTRLRS